MEVPKAALLTDEQIDEALARLPNVHQLEWGVGRDLADAASAHTAEYYERILQAAREQGVVWEKLPGWEVA